MGAVEDGFGRRVRREREARGWSQVKLTEELSARGIDLHPSAIAKLEDRNVARPRAIRLDEAAAIAEIFDLSIDDLVEGHPAIGALLDAARWLASLKQVAEGGKRAEEWLLMADRQSWKDTTNDEWTHEVYDAVRTLRRLVQEATEQLEASAAGGDRWTERAWNLRSGGG